MSTLSKVFVILVFMISLVWTGIIATLFAQRVDWKDKFVKEVNHHFQTQEIKNAEIRAGQVEAENLRTYVEVMEAKNDQLGIELASGNSKQREIQRQLDFTKGLLVKLQAAQDVLSRQLEVQLAQIGDLMVKVEEFREKLSRAVNERTTAITELQYARQEAERLSKDISELETRHLTLAKDHHRLEQTITRLNEIGVRTDVEPRKPLDGKVTAVAIEIGLVVLSIGRDAGVMSGDEFTVYRGDMFVSKIVIDRVDRSWSAGRIVLKKMDPRVSDDVSNHILISGYEAGSGGK